MKSLLVAFCLSAACAVAAGPGGPVPGYVLDSRTATVRAVYGIPGALQLSAPVTLPFGVASAGFGPAGDYAVAITDGQPAHAFVIQALASATPALIDLGAVPDGTRVLAVNNSGTGALLYAGDGSVVQFVTGLPQSPALSGGIATTALAGAITAALLDDAAGCAIVGTGALETLCADGSTQRLLPQTNWNISALTFANQGADVVFADQAGKQIVLVGQYKQAANTSVLGTATGGIDTPVGLQTMANGQIMAADSTASALFVIDPTGQNAMQNLPLTVAPSQLSFLSDRSILLLNSPSSVPFTVLDLTSMRSFFIPAN